jgi:stage II sporulation protein Q
MDAEVMEMKEEEKKLIRKTGIQRFFKKRWVYPAVYIGAAAIILASFLWFQSRGDEGNPKNIGYESNPEMNLADKDAMEVNMPVENFEWPVANADEVEIKTPFYDANASQEEQESALVSYENSFQPNTGIDIVAKNGETFDVTAAMSGTVSAVEEDALLGNTIVIEHANGVETRYQSVSDIQVKAGDKVKQGQVIAKAGRSLINEDAGIHVHFEIRKDGVAYNPVEYFKKPATSLKEGENSTGTGEKADEEANDSSQSDGSDAGQTSPDQTQGPTD